MPLVTGLTNLLDPAMQTTVTDLFMKVVTFIMNLAYTVAVFMINLLTQPLIAGGIAALTIIGLAYAAFKRRAGGKIGL